MPPEFWWAWLQFALLAAAVFLTDVSFDLLDDE